MDITELLKEITKLNELDCKTITEKFIKFNEEFGEFSAEVVKMLGLTQKPFDVDHLVEEAADTL